MSSLPKKTKHCTEKKAWSVGYSIHRVHRLLVIKFFYILAASIGVGLVLIICWLVKHPRDIQIASIPYFMLMNAVGGFSALPDIYIG